MTAPATRLAAQAWGEAAVLLVARGGTEEERWRAALALHRALGRAALPGVLDRVHGPESVLVELDPGVTDRAAVVAAALALPLHREEAAPRRFVLPVRFGDEDGPDLDDVARTTGRTAADLVDELTAADLVIRSVGGPVLPLLQRRGQTFSVARLAAPRPRVPAGSLGLAGDRACVYPVDGPGGWRLVGRTPLALVDVGRDPVVPYRAGDAVRLVAVSAAEAAALAGRRLEPS